MTHSQGKGLKRQNYPNRQKHWASQRENDSRVDESQASEKIKYKSRGEFA
jgi:hypothetical protein